MVCLHRLLVGDVEERQGCGAYGSFCIAFYTDGPDCYRGAAAWAGQRSVSTAEQRFLPSSDLFFWSGAAITAAGLLFCVWARRYLGGNWSQAVTVKQDHELIQSGPYRFVRHPIYTGLLLAFAGSAIARGEWRGLLAVALMFVTLWSKLRLEEKWMRAQFGASYEEYSRRVSALVPGIL